jgi:hypothetical protein
LGSDVPYDIFAVWIAKHTTSRNHQTRACQSQCSGSIGGAKNGGIPEMLRHTAHHVWSIRAAVVAENAKLRFSALGSLAAFPADIENKFDHIRKRVL